MRANKYNYHNGSQRIATRIGELDHLPEDIIDTSAVALERITNAREYMHEMLNVSAVQAVDTASVFADIEGNGQEDLQWQCMEDAEWMFHAVIHCLHGYR